MKVNNPMPKVVKLEDVKVGECFRIGREVCMRTHAYVDRDVSPYLGNYCFKDSAPYILAVSLDRGTLVIKSRDAEVTLVDVSVHVNIVCED